MRLNNFNAEMAAYDIAALVLAKNEVTIAQVTRIVRSHAAPEYLRRDILRRAKELCNEFDTPAPAPDRKK